MLSEVDVNLQKIILVQSTEIDSCTTLFHRFSDVEKPLVTEVKYLGIILDKMQSWNLHSSWEGKNITWNFSTVYRGTR